MPFLTFRKHRFYLSPLSRAAKDIQACCHAAYDFYYESYQFVYIPTD